MPGLIIDKPYDLNDKICSKYEDNMNIWFRVDYLCTILDLLTKFLSNYMTEQVFFTLSKRSLLESLLCIINKMFFSNRGCGL